MFLSFLFLRKHSVDLDHSQCIRLSMWKGNICGKANLMMDLRKRQMLQWSFHKTGSSQAEICGRVQASGGASVGLRGYQPGEKIELLYATKSCNLVHFGWKMDCSALNGAFLNTFTVGTLFPCVLTAFQQWERRFHAFFLEINPEMLTTVVLIIHLLTHLFGYLLFCCRYTAGLYLVRKWRDAGSR